MARGQLCRYSGLRSGPVGGHGHSVGVCVCVRLCAISDIHDHSLRLGLW